MLDFGNTYVFPDWCNAKVLDSDMGFGRELGSLALMAHSITFHVKKYAGIQIKNALADELMSIAHEAHRKSFEVEVLRVWGLTNSDDDAERALRFTKRMYEAHQKISVNYSLGQSSNITALRSDGHADEGTVSNETEVVVDGMMREMGCTEAASSRYHHMRVSAKRYFRYRRSSDRAWLQRESEKLIASLPGNGMGVEVSAFIDKCIGQSRRHWPMLPSSLLVVAQVSELEGVALYCIDEGSKPIVWLEGDVVNGELRVFGRSIEVERIEGLRMRSGRGGFYSEAAISEGRLMIEFLGIEVPTPAIVYDSAEFERFSSVAAP